MSTVSEVDDHEASKPDMLMPFMRHGPQTTEAQAIAERFISAFGQQVMTWGFTSPGSDFFGENEFRRFTSYGKQAVGLRVSWTRRSWRVQVIGRTAFQFPGSEPGEEMNFRFAPRLWKSDKEQWSFTTQSSPAQIAQLLAEIFTCVEEEILPFLLRTDGPERLVHFMLTDYQPGMLLSPRLFHHGQAMWVARHFLQRPAADEAIEQLELALIRAKDMWESRRAFRQCGS